MKLINWISWITKRTALEWAIFIFAILSGYMIYVYFKTFPDGYSDNFEKWGAFGDYFGSITGLLAFLGVLYSMMEAKKETKANEERGIFFTMLGLYQKQVDSMTDGKVTGVEAFTNYSKELNNITTIYIICNEIVSNKEYKINKDVNSWEYLVQKKLFETFQLDIEYVGINEIKPFIYQYLSTDSKLIIDKYSEYSFFFESYASSILARIIKDPIEKEILTKYLLLLMNRSIKILNLEYNHHLGQYFRSIYYLLEIISTYKEKKQYSKIFRAQLSSSELILLLYNALCSQSTIKTIDYYLEHDIFNNLSVDNNVILRNVNIAFNAKDYINELLAIEKKLKKDD